MENKIWDTVPLAAIADIICGGTPSTAIPDYWSPAEIDWVTAKDISEAQTAFIHSTERKISQKGLKESSSKLIPPLSTLLIARGATMGRCRLIYSKMALNQTCYAIVAKPDCDPLFLYYFFSNQFENIQQISHGSVFNTIIGTGLQSYPVPLPPLSVQKEIGSILVSFDKKIDLNHRMNQTLEEMARTLFKSWFVDFEPVRAKAEGRETGLPAEIAALFPDELDESPDGELPSGWEICSVGEVCDFSYGKALKEENRVSGSVPVFGSNGQIGWHDTSLVDGPGIVVGRKGNPGIVTWSQEAFFPIDTAFYVSIKKEQVNLYFLYFALEALNLPSLGADSAVPGLNRNIAYLSKMVVPKKCLVDIYRSMVEPFFIKIHKNNREIRLLTEIRNHLLSRLMNGEILIKAE